MLNQLKQKTYNLNLSIIFLFLLTGCFYFKNKKYNQNNQYLVQDSLKLTFTSLEIFKEISKDKWFVHYQLENLSKSPILFNGNSRFNQMMFRLEIYDKD